MIKDKDWYRLRILISLSEKEGDKFICKSAYQMIEELGAKLGDERKAFMRALRSLEADRKIYRTEPDPGHNYVVWWYRIK